MQLISSFIIGCSMGITVIMGKYIGSKDQNNSYKAYKSAIFLFLIFGLLIGIPFIILFNVISSVMQAYGDSKTPMYTVLIACIFNIAFDFLLAGVFKLWLRLLL